MSTSTWTDDDAQRALQIWAAHKCDHDVSALTGQTAGIDPKSGRIWFGESASDIRRQQQDEGIDAPFYCVRVGYDYYVRKGGRR